MECKGKSILIIDDEKAIRESISDFLEDFGCMTSVAANGLEALEVLKVIHPDAILADLNMPEMDGFELIDHVAAEFPETPVIVLSGVGIIDRAVEAIRKGAWDFLPKPLSSFSVLQITLDRVFERAKLLKENRIYREHLEEEVRKKTEQVLEISRAVITTQKEIILKLGDVVETRSHETAHHVQRVSEYAELLSRLAGLSEEDSQRIRLASPRHDVGKIGISDQILNKKGSLTEDEFKIIKNHTTIGHSIFKESPLPVLKLAAEIALYHHEKWNGGGYPTGISGEEIPFSARITSIVDVFDAITHARMYKEAWDMDRSLEYIKSNGGILFDPGLTELFLNNLDKFMEIYNKINGGNREG
jgi:putative two-component system response regulator